MATPAALSSSGVRAAGHWADRPGMPRPMTMRITLMAAMAPALSSVDHTWTDALSRVPRTLMTATTAIMASDAKRPAPGPRGTSWRR